MFIIQYQYYQKDSWYDDPYFMAFKTLTEAKAALVDIALKAEGVRYRIIERIEYIEENEVFSL